MNISINLDHVIAVITMFLGGAGSAWVLYATIVDYHHGAGVDVLLGGAVLLATAIITSAGVRLWLLS